MTDIKIRSMTDIVTVVGTEKLEIDDGGSIDYNVTPVELGTYVNSVQNYPSLSTTAKDIVGAINEVEGGLVGAGYWTRASSKLTPTTAGDAINIGTGGLTDSRKIAASLGVTYLTDASNLTLGTTSQNIFGAINELNGELSNKFNTSGGTITGATVIEGNTEITDNLHIASTSITGWGTHSCAIASSGSTLTGTGSVLICGTNSSITGVHSLGCGYGVAISKNGCVCLTDQVTGTLSSTADNQFSASFSGGYRFLDGTLLFDTGLSDSITTITLFDKDQAFTANSDSHLATQKATKAFIVNYVAANASGMQIKAQCATVATSNITLSGEQTIGGVLTNLSRVLVIGQTDQTKNGLYVSAPGVWARSSDANTGALLWKAYVYIAGGTYLGNSYSNNNATLINLGVDNITFALSQTSSISHNSTLGIQGGAVGDYQHLTTAQVGYLPSSDEKAAISGALGTLSASNVVIDTNTFNLALATKLSGSLTAGRIPVASGTSTLTDSTKFTVDYTLNTNTKSALTFRSPNTSSYIQLATDQTGNLSQLSTNSANLELWANSAKVMSFSGTLSCAIVGSLSASNLSGSNTGDETTTTIQTKLGLASASTSGYLSSANWNTFNGKQNAITPASLTEATSSVLTITGGSSALLSAATIQVKQATTSVSGYLSSTDWNTFNGKQSALSRGNLVETGSSILSITGGSNAVIGTGTSINVMPAGASQSGYLTVSDWNAFNNKQPLITPASLSESTSNVLVITGGAGALLAGTSIQVRQATSGISGYLAGSDWNLFNGKQNAGNYITALTSDITASGPGSVAATIAAGVVTNAKLATMAATSLKGNNAAGVAAPLDLTVSQVKTLLGAGANSGLATLDVNGKVPASQLSVAGGLSYQGVWDASGGAYPTGATSNQFWIVSVAGTMGGVDYLPKDWLVYEDVYGWAKVDNTDSVASVAGKTGVVTLVKGDVGLSNVENTALSTWTGSSNITTTGVLSLPDTSTAVTQTAGNNTTRIATTAFTATSLAAFTGSSNITTVGVLSLPDTSTAVTQPAGNSSTRFATTAFVQNAVSSGAVAYAQTTNSATVKNLVATDAKYQEFVGTANQIILLPSCLTLSIGSTFVISNKSSGSLTVKTYDTSVLFPLMAPNSHATFVCKDINSARGYWNYTYDLEGQSAILNAVPNYTIKSFSTQTPTYNLTMSQQNTIFYYSGILAATPTANLPDARTLSVGDQFIIMAYNCAVSVLKGDGASLSTVGTASSYSFSTGSMICVDNTTIAGIWSAASPCYNLVTDLGGIAYVSKSGATVPSFVLTTSGTGNLTLGAGGILTLNSTGNTGMTSTGATYLTWGTGGSITSTAGNMSLVASSGTMYLTSTTGAMVQSADTLTIDGRHSGYAAPTIGSTFGVSLGQAYRQIWPANTFEPQLPYQWRATLKGCVQIRFTTTLTTASTTLYSWTNPDNTSYFLKITANQGGAVTGGSGRGGCQYGCIRFGVRNGASYVGVGQNVINTANGGYNISYVGSVVTIAWTGYSNAAGATSLTCLMDITSTDDFV